MKKILLLSLIILSSNIVLGQITTIECPDHEGTPKAQNKVRFFLSFADSQDERELVGATNEAVDQIEYVTDAAACNSLMTIINGTEKYRTIKDGLEGTERTIYLYKTNSLYYMFWDYKAEFNDRLRTGPKRLFIIVNHDFSEVWDFYF